VTSQLVRVRDSSIDETARNEISGCHSPLHFDSTDIWTVLLSLQIVVSEQSRVRYDRCCSTISLKRLACRAGRKL